jgi:hypothetical protein
VGKAVGKEPRRTVAVAGLVGRVRLRSEADKVGRYRGVGGQGGCIRGLQQMGWGWRLKV